MRPPVKIHVEISFDIDLDGKVKLGVKGAKGKKCLEITKEIEKELGEVLGREYTSDYYQEEVIETEKVKTQK